MSAFFGAKATLPCGSLVELQLTLAVGSEILDCAFSIHGCVVVQGADIPACYLLNEVLAPHQQWPQELAQMAGMARTLFCEFRAKSIGHDTIPLCVLTSLEQMLTHHGQPFQCGAMYIA